MKLVTDTELPHAEIEKSIDKSSYNQLKGKYHRLNVDNIDIGLQQWARLPEHENLQLECLEKGVTSDSYR